MEPSRLATRAEKDALDAAAQTFMAAVLAVTRNLYGPTFEDWCPDNQQACVIGLAAQCLLTPEAFAAPTINLDGAGHGFGIALGIACVNLTDPAMHQVLTRFSEAFATGRIEALTARMGMKTEGTA